MRALLVLALLALPSARGQVHRDEQVILFPTSATLSEDGQHWLIPVHGWICEPEEDSLVREAALEVLARSLGLEEDAASTATFRYRAAPFLADNERGKQIQVRIGQTLHELEPSAPDGHFHGALRLKRETVDPLAHATRGPVPRLTVTVVTQADDPRTFTGEVLLPPRTGRALISDIDDTIKVSQVTDRKALLARTFLQPFEAVPGMAETYAGWARQGLVVHYLSASPWQLFLPLHHFLSTAGFPDGVIHLRSFRVKDSSFWSLFASPREYKIPVLEEILARQPGYRFVLVGDSGEEDPEIYGEIARRHPESIESIWIRDVTGEAGDSSRYEAAFQGVPAGRWRVFRDASEIDRPVR